MGSRPRFDLYLAAFPIALVLVASASHAQTGGASLTSTGVSETMPAAAEPHDGDALWRILSKIIATPNGNVTREIFENAFGTPFPDKYSVAVSSKGNIVHQHTYEKAFYSYASAILSTGDNSQTMFSFGVDSLAAAAGSSFSMPCVNRNVVDKDAAAMGWTKDPATNSDPYYLLHSNDRVATEVFYKKASNPRIYLKMTINFGGFFSVACLSGISVWRETK